MNHVLWHGLSVLLHAVTISNAHILYSSSGRQHYQHSQQCHKHCSHEARDSLGLQISAELRAMSHAQATSTVHEFERWELFLGALTNHSIRMPPHKTASLVLIHIYCKPTLCLINCLFQNLIQSRSIISSRNTSINWRKWTRKKLKRSMK